MKRWLIIVVTFVAGLYFFIDFLLPEHVILGRMDFSWSRFNETVTNVFTVMLSMSFGLGVINILRVYGYILIRGRKGAANSAALILAMLVTMVFGVWSEFGSRDSVKSFFHDFLFSGLYNNLGSAMFSLLAFYIAGAAYRSFRVHNLEAALMMLAALVVMIGQIPLGFYVSARLPMARNWLMVQVSTPAFRGILFGILVAALITAVRMWLSLEKAGTKSGGR